jgi:hypothetical protein
VGLNNLPSLSERRLAKNKNATDFTDCTDSKKLADDAFELERPGAEVEEQRQPVVPWQSGNARLDRDL